MTMEIICRICGQPFTPTPEDIRAGLWRTCPPCRDGPSQSGIRSHCVSSQARSGANKQPEVSSQQKAGTASWPRKNVWNCVEASAC